MRQQKVTSEGPANFWHTSHITYTSQSTICYYNKTCTADNQ